MAARKSGRTRSSSAARSTHSTTRRAAPTSKTAARGRVQPKSAAKSAPKSTLKSSPKTAGQRSPKVRATKSAAPKSVARPTGTKPRAGTPASGDRALQGVVEFTSAIGAITQHLDFTTHDPEALRRFYADVLGLRAESDGTPESFRVRLNAGASVAFRPPAPGPPEQWRPPREPVMVFVVADADQAYETLRARGVSFDRPPADLSWGARGALLRDPEGRMVWIVHPRVEA